MDEAAGGGPSLDAVLLEVDAQRPGEVGAVPAIMLEEWRQRAPRERLELDACRSSPYGPSSRAPMTAPRRPSLSMTSSARRDDANAGA
jgi:hypothetical protein